MVNNKLFYVENRFPKHKRLFWNLVTLPKKIMTYHDNSIKIHMKIHFYTFWKLSISYVIWFIQKIYMCFQGCIFFNLPHPGDGGGRNLRCFRGRVSNLMTEEISYCSYPPPLQKKGNVKMVENWTQREMNYGSRVNLFFFCLILNFYTSFE